MFLLIPRCFIRARLLHSLICPPRPHRRHAARLWSGVRRTRECVVVDRQQSPAAEHLRFHCTRSIGAHQRSRRRFHVTPRRPACVPAALQADVTGGRLLPGEQQTLLDRRSWSSEIESLLSRCRLWNVVVTRCLQLYADDNNVRPLFSF